MSCNVFLDGLGGVVVQTDSAAAMALLVEPALNLRKKPTEPHYYIGFELVVLATAVLGFLGSAFCLLAGLFSGARDAFQGLIVGIVAFLGTAWSSFFAQIVLDAARKLHSIDLRLKGQSADSVPRGGSASRSWRARLALRKWNATGALVDADPEAVTEAIGYPASAPATDRQVVPFSRKHLKAVPTSDVKGDLIFGAKVVAIPDHDRA